MKKKRRKRKKDVKVKKEDKPSSSSSSTKESRGRAKFLAGLKMIKGRGSTASASLLNTSLA